MTSLPSVVSPLVRPDYAPQTHVINKRDYVPFSALAVYSIFQSARRGCTATIARHRLLPGCTQDSFLTRCKGGMLPEHKRLAWLLAAPESGPFSLIQNSFCAMSPHSIIRTCVSMAACIAEGRLAPANGRNPGRQDRRAAPVCSFVVPKMGPKTGPKNGAAILPEEGKASKMAARFWDQGVAYTVSPPCVQ